MDAFNNKMKEISDINDKVNEMIPGGESGPDYECEKTRLNEQVVGNGPDHDDPNDNRLISVINENLQNIREKIGCILTGTIRYELTEEDIKYLINIANNKLPQITVEVNGRNFRYIIRMARLQRIGGKRKNKKRKSRKKRGGVKKKKGEKVPAKKTKAPNNKSINKKSIKKTNKKPSNKESPKHDPTIAQELAAVGSDSDIDLGEFNFDLNEPLPSPTITETWKPAPGTIAQLKAIYQEMGNNSSSDDDMDDDGFDELMAELAQDNEQSDNKQPDNKKEGGHRKKRSRKRKTYRRKSRRKKKSKRKTKRKGRR